MSRSDPPRLLDGDSAISSDLRATLEAARDELPNAQQLAGLGARLPLGAAVPPAPTELASLPAASAAPWASKVLLGLTLVVGGGSAALYASREAATTPRAVTVQAPVTQPAPEPPPIAAASSTERSAEPPAAPRDEEKPQPPAAKAADPRPVASSSAHAGVAHASKPESSADTEIRLLQRAHDALGAKPADALGFAEEHERAYPAGSLLQERELIAISALARLGRAADARSRADRFLSRFPTSAHRRRIEAVVGRSPSSDPTPGDAAPPTP
jgi:outer membrane biosynthesis protein TonB